MIPLKIRATMMEPVCYYGDGLHIDGPIAFGVFQDLDYSIRQKMPPLTCSWAEDFDLPLEKWKVKIELSSFINPLLLDNYDQVWGWKASAVFADWLQQDGHIITRQPNFLQLSRYTKSPSINLGAGQLKAVSLKLPTMLASILEWYCVGDPEKILYLLETHVPAIGKLHNKGLGRVLKWEIEEAEEDKSVSYKGVVTRVMPKGFEGTGFEAIATIRPPYHHRSRLVPAILPPHCYTDLIGEEDVCMYEGK